MEPVKSTNFLYDSKDIDAPDEIKVYFDDENIFSGVNPNSNNYHCKYFIFKETDGRYRYFLGAQYFGSSTFQGDKADVLKHNKLIIKFIKNLEEKLIFTQEIPFTNEYIQSVEFGGKQLEDDKLNQYKVTIFLREIDYRNTFELSAVSIIKK